MLKNESCIFSGRLQIYFENYIIDFLWAVGVAQNI